MRIEAVIEGEAGKWSRQLFSVYLTLFASKIEENEGKVWRSPLPITRYCSFFSVHRPPVSLLCLRTYETRNRFVEVLNLLQPPETLVYSGFLPLLFALWVRTVTEHQNEV